MKLSDRVTSHRFPGGVSTLCVCLWVDSLLNVDAVQLRRAEASHGLSISTLLAQILPPDPQGTLLFLASVPERSSSLPPARSFAHHALACTHRRACRKHALHATMNQDIPEARAKHLTNAHTRLLIAPVPGASLRSTGAWLAMAQHSSCFFQAIFIIRTLAASSVLILNMEQNVSHCSLIIWINETDNVEHFQGNGMNHPAPSPESFRHSIYRERQA